MRHDLQIRYEAALHELRGATYEETAERLAAELPYAWLDRYALMCHRLTNVLVTDLGTFAYLFDFTSELEGVQREDRLVAAHGRSDPSGENRPSSRLAGFPGSDERGDRGHFMSHAAGGGVDINLFHQDARLNRGWSPAGSEYRAMERYCAAHAGTYFFSRPIYADDTARPAELEFGVLRLDETWWIDSFAN